jgi:hypothetical protein
VARYVPPFQQSTDSLFFESFRRGKRSLDAEPAGRDRQYIDSILVAIAELSGGAVPGPADPFP